MVEPVLPALDMDFSAWSEAFLRSLSSFSELWAAVLRALSWVAPAL